MTSTLSSDHAADAYDCLAVDYDEFTAGYAHDKWFAEIECRAVSLGLRGRRALDLACGTGKSTAPLIQGGYTVAACDISSAMVREARRKFPEHAGAFQVADMRVLPALGVFDLVLCLNDALNYLLDADEVCATFVGAARQLAAGGLFVFDLNTLATYRSAFAQTVVKETGGRFFSWCGESVPDAGPGELAAARLEVFAERGAGLWERRSSRHLQRHHPPEMVVKSLEKAGLCCCAVYGQLPGAEFESAADESRHSKFVYFAKAPDCPEESNRGGVSGLSRTFASLP
jgi:SAM-dependent methyltransferase